MMEIWESALICIALKKELFENVTNSNGGRASTRLESVNQYYVQQD